MHLINCDFLSHGADILALFNDAIIHSTALYEYSPRDLDDIENWFKLKATHNFPVLGIEDNDGQLLGFISYGSFRPYPANQFSAELAVYVQPQAQGRGIASRLMAALIEHAKANNIHTLIAAIDEDNKASIALHEKLGFELAGTLKEVGFKFDRWLNLCFYQLILTQIKEREITNE